MEVLLANFRARAGMFENHFLASSPSFWHYSTEKVDRHQKEFFLEKMIPAVKE